MKKITIKDGCYYAYRMSALKYEKISNFTINIKYSLHFRDEMKREVTFKSNDTETSSFILESEKMASAGSFKALCLKKGNFMFEGKTIDLEEIWKEKFIANEGEPHVYLIDSVGYIEEHKVWLFKNIAIKNKKVIFPDENGVFWLGYNKGLKILALSTGRQMPKLKEPEKGYDLSNQIMLAEDAMNRNLGCFKGSLLLGYIAATVYSKYVHNRFGFFPILFVYGKYQSGKNVFCGLLMKFFGLSQNFATSAQENTQTGVSRLLSYYSYLPIWIDEYRNSDRVRGMSSFFRNVYNKISPVKANKKDYGVREVEVKGNLILSGEEMPIDTALRSRCIPINLTSKERDDSAYSEVSKLSKEFKKITFCLIKGICKESIEEYLRSVSKIKQGYIKQNLNSRQAEVFAVLMAGRKLLNKFADSLEGFDQWALSQIKNENRKRNEESPVVVFWETIEGLMSKAAITKAGNIELDKKEGKVYIWFAELYRAYEKDVRNRKTESIRSRQAILDQLSEEPYFIAKNISRRISGTIRSCLVLDYNKCPKNIKVIAHNIF